MRESTETTADGGGPESYPAWPLPGPSQEPSGGMKPATVSQLKKLSGAAFKQRGVAAYEHLGLLMGCKGSAFWYCRRLMMRWLGEEPKAGKGRVLGDFGWNNHGKTEEQGDKREPVMCRQAADRSCVAVPCT